MRRLVTFIAILFCFGRAVYALPPNQANQVNQVPPQTVQALPASETDVVSAKLKAALSDATKNLGELEPWQKKVFDEEILPQYQRFIRDYRPNGTGLEVEVDTDSLKKYLKFRPGKQDPKILVYLKPDPNCPKCTQALPEIQAMVKTGMERRAFVPVTIGPEDLGDPQTAARLTGKNMFDRVLSVAKARNIPSLLIVQWQVAPVDDIDSAHADEEHFLMNSYVYLKDVGTNEGHMELLSNDSFPVSARRLLTDAYTDLGGKVDMAIISQSDSSKDEISVELSGITDFQTYSKMKSQIQTVLKDILIGPIEERKISRGRITLAVFTDKPIEWVKTQISNINAPPVQLSFLGMHDRTIQMEIRR